MLCPPGAGVWPSVPLGPERSFPLLSTAEGVLLSRLDDPTALLAIELANASDVTFTSIMLHNDYDSDSWALVLRNCTGCSVQSLTIKEGTALLQPPAVHPYGLIRVESSTLVIQSIQATGLQNALLLADSGSSVSVQNGQLSGSPDMPLPADSAVFAVAGGSRLVLNSLIVHSLQSSGDRAEPYQQGVLVSASGNGTSVRLGGASTLSFSRDQLRPDAALIYASSGASLVVDSSVSVVAPEAGQLPWPLLLADGAAAVTVGPLSVQLGSADPASPAPEASMWGGTAPVQLRNTPSAATVAVAGLGVSVLGGSELLFAGSSLPLWLEASDGAHVTLRGVVLRDAVLQGALAARAGRASWGQPGSLL